jgi:hypothetical protein
MYGFGYSLFSSTNSILANSSSGGGVDPDAQAFITAAAITDLTQQEAINQLVIDLKGYGVWSKMKAIYPFVGGTAASHKYNLKDPRDLDVAFRLVFNGGGTHSSNGYLPNGINAFANTFMNHSTILPLNSFQYGYYSRGTTTAITALMGAYNSAGQYTQFVTNDNVSSITGDAFALSPSSRVIGAVPNFTGLLHYGRLNSTTLSIYRNGNILATSTGAVSGIAPTLNIYIGTLNYIGNPLLPTTLACAFSYISDGLNSTENANFYTAVQAFQTTLGRSIGTQTVSDADAQAFVTNAGIVDQVEANAVNNLVIGMKADGIWSKMKAIYPFVGGTASTHKFNLKNPLDTDAAFRLVFFGGTTHSSNGISFATNGYADTKLNTTTNSTNTNYHQSFYSRTVGGNNSWVDMGNWQSGVRINFIQIANASNALDAYIFDTNATSFPTTNGQGFYCASRNGTSKKTYRNGVTLTNQTSTSGGNINHNVFIGAVNLNGSASNYITRNCAFSSIGEGLTDTEATNLNTRVQTFQTALNRQV